MVSNSLKKKIIQENANNNNHTIKKTKSQFCFTFIAADKYAQLRLFHHNSGSRTKKNNFSLKFSRAYETHVWVVNEPIKQLTLNYFLFFLTGFNGQENVAMVILLFRTKLSRCELLMVNANMKCEKQKCEYHRKTTTIPIAYEQNMTYTNA